MAHAYECALAAKARAPIVAQQKQSVTPKHDSCSSGGWTTDTPPVHLTPYSFSEVFGAFVLSVWFVWS
jgi:hypothetical protein